MWALSLPRGGLVAARQSEERPSHPEASVDLQDWIVSRLAGY